MPLLLLVPAEINPRQSQVFDSRDFEIEMLQREIYQKKIMAEILIKEIKM